MKKSRQMVMFFLVLIVIFAFNCSFSESVDFKNGYIKREDGSYYLNLNIKGSLQRPVIINDKYMVLTNYYEGYNEKFSRIIIWDIKKETWSKLGSNGKTGLNSNGSIYGKNDDVEMIVYSSKKNNFREIFFTAIYDGKEIEHQITDRKKYNSSEPSISPDCQWVVFQSSLDINSDYGQIIKYRIDKTSDYILLTDANSICRNPKFSPDGNLILYEKYEDRFWDIWVTDINGKYHRKITSGKGDKTNGSFSPDGRLIAYSSNEGKLEYPNIFISDVFGHSTERLTKNNGYDGFPSWSPDGKSIIFESVNTNLKKAKGTYIYIIDIPEKLMERLWT